MQLNGVNKWDPARDCGSPAQFVVQYAHFALQYERAPNQCLISYSLPAFAAEGFDRRALDHHKRDHGLRSERVRTVLRIPQCIRGACTREFEGTAGIDVEGRLCRNIAKMCVPRRMLTEGFVVDPCGQRSKAPAFDLGKLPTKHKVCPSLPSLQLQVSRPALTVSLSHQAGHDHEDVRDADKSSSPLPFKAQQLWRRISVDI